MFALGVAEPNVVSVGDFFDFEDQAWGLVGRRFDAVIGNPPFLRYHSFPEAQRERAFRIMRTAGLKPTRLTNAWVPFLIAASLRLKDNGRLAMVIPAELMQVKYAEETRTFLARHFGSLTILTFRRLVFADIQQEVVLLLAEKTPRIKSGIDVIELEDADDLATYRVNLRERVHLKTIDHAQEKWTKYYLDADEIELLRQAKLRPDLRRFGQLGCVDVGVVTGNNDFFVLRQEQISRWQLEGSTIPLVGRSAQLPGLTLTAAEWEACAKPTACAACSICRKFRWWNCQRRRKRMCSMAKTRAWRTDSSAATANSGTSRRRCGRRMPSFFGRYITTRNWS